MPHERFRPSSLGVDVVLVMTPIDQCRRNGAAQRGGRRGLGPRQRGHQFQCEAGPWERSVHGTSKSKRFNVASMRYQPRKRRCRYRRRFCDRAPASTVWWHKGASAVITRCPSFAQRQPHGSRPETSALTKACRNRFALALRASPVLCKAAPPSNGRVRSGKSCPRRH